jgi:carboxypeptidase C (cathepsin A)
VILGLGRITPDPPALLYPRSHSKAFNSYVRDELKWGSDLSYEALTDKVQSWSYETQQNRYVDKAESLRRAIEQTPSLKVLVVGEYYHLATPFFSAEYTFNHLGLSPALQNNARFMYCDAGHILYTYKPCLDKLKSAMADFHREALQAPTAPKAGSR